MARVLARAAQWERENREREHRHLERRRLQTEAAKVVALEIASQAEPLRRLVKSGTFHHGEECGDRSAWDANRTVLAGALKIEGLLNVDSSYSALAEAKQAASHDIGFEFLIKDGYAWARELLSRMDAGRDQLLAVAATFDTLEDIKTGRAPQEL